MSLAELLKADLEDLEDQDEDMLNKDDDESKYSSNGGGTNRQSDDLMQVEEVGPSQSGNNNNNANKRDSVKAIAKLLDSEKLKSVMNRIAIYQEQERQRVEIKGTVEQDPEYKLIVEANNLTVEIDTEINIIHKYIRDKVIL